MDLADEPETKSPTMAPSLAAALLEHAHARRTGADELKLSARAKLLAAELMRLFIAEAQRRASNEAVRAGSAGACRAAHTLTAPPP